MAYSIAFYGILKLAIVSTPNGGVTLDKTRVLLLYGVLFVGMLLLGGLVFFRHMTRREIFLSASIVVLYRVIFLLIQWALRGATGSSVIWMIYLLRPFEWCSFLTQIVSLASYNPWVSSSIEVLVPYLFVLFGKGEGGRVP
jgi:hypothetical protein